MYNFFEDLADNFSSKPENVMANGDTGYGFGRTNLRTTNYYGKQRGYRCVIPFSVEKFKLYNSLFPKEEYRMDSIGRVNFSDVYNPYDYPTITGVKHNPDGVVNHPERTLEITYSKLVEKKDGPIYNWKRYWIATKSYINPTGLSMAIKLKEGDLIAWEYHGRTALGLWTTDVGRVKCPTGYYGISLAWNYRDKGEFTFCDSIDTDQGEIPIESDSSPLYGCPFIRLAYRKELELFYNKVIDYSIGLDYYGLRNLFDKAINEKKDNTPEFFDLKANYLWALTIESGMSKVIELLDKYKEIKKKKRK